MNTNYKLFTVQFIFIIFFVNKMMSTDTEMISKYLEEILNGVQDRENEELIQNVQQLADLSSIEFKLK